MSEAELIRLNYNRKCTLYSIQFLTEDEAEYERFYNRFKEDAVFNEDLISENRIRQIRCDGTGNTFPY